MAFTAKDAITCLYRPAAGLPVQDIAREAYASALQALRKELGHAFDQNWINQQASLDGVLDVLENAKNNQANCSAKFKAVFHWLEAISSRVIYYGSVLDALAQHHPEYVSLAWGTIKFVLMGVINHTELLVKLAEAFTEIGDALKSASDSCMMYQTDGIQNITSRLYLQIMRFCRKAVKWYTRHPLKRAFSSIINPYALSYKDIVEQIRYCSATLKNRSSTAMGAELRDVHISVQTQGAKLDGFASAMLDMQTKLGSVVGLKDMLTAIYTTANSSKFLSERICVGMDDIKPRIHDMQPRIHDLQVSAILQTLLPEKDPEEVFLRIQATAKRNQGRTHVLNQAELHRCLDRWFNTSTSSLLILRANARSEGLVKTVSVDLIKLIRSSPNQVFFALAEHTSRDRVTPLTNTLKALIHQALQKSRDFFTQHPDLLQAARYASDHSEEEWLHLLGKLYARVPRTFLVLDTSDLYQQYRDDATRLERLLALFRALVRSVRDAGGCLKVVLVSYGTAVPGPVDVSPEGVAQIVCCLRAQIVPPRLQRQYAAAASRRRQVWQRARVVGAI